MKQLNTTRSRKEQLIKNLRFNYDELNDLLYIYKDGSSVYSNVMIGEFHLEFDRQRTVVGVEILKASEILAEYGAPADVLKNIKNIDLRVVTSNNSLLIFIIIRSLNQENEVAITMNNLESPIMQAIATA